MRSSKIVWSGKSFHHPYGLSNKRNTDTTTYSNLLTGVRKWSTKLDCSSSSYKKLNALCHIGMHILAYLVSYLVRVHDTHDAYDTGRDQTISEMYKVQIIIYPHQTDWSGMVICTRMRIHLVYRTRFTKENPIYPLNSSLLSSFLLHLFLFPISVLILIQLPETGTHKTPQYK